MIKKCFQCGNEFYRKPSHFEKAKYCSRKCKDKSQIGIKHTIECKEKIRQTLLSKNGTSGSYKKGHIPWTKNKPRPKSVCLKISYTRKIRNYSGEKSGRWKGGRIKCRYILIKTPGHPNCKSTPYIPEHRLVMEKYIGRFLKPEERVHHINKNTFDNRIENLMLFKDMMSHRKYHIIQEGIKPNEIIFDGSKI